MTEESKEKDVNKKHRPRHSGRKSDKKKPVDLKKSNNVKAFAVQHTTKAARLVQRTLDHQSKRLRQQKCIYQAETVPPYVVAIVGPPKSGKSTLLRGLLKHFARQSLNVIKGPITVVVGKKARLTFIECGCDINSMLDAAKIADIVLLMVNVRSGLEMYHFEFINMLQVHGMPRVLPILNHLDTYKDASSSRAIRKKIKQRLWTDLNTKIFLLSKFQYKKYATLNENSQNSDNMPGEYLLAEIRRMARLLLIKTPRPTDWRKSHPYILVDRIEDITDSSTVNSDDSNRHISLYGWVRGAPLPPALTCPGIHIAGLGDFHLTDCTKQPDPCPMPTKSNNENAKKLSRHLSEKDRKLYAPMSSLGGVLFDRDATYIDLGGSHYLTSGRHRGKEFNRSIGGITQANLDEVHFTLDSNSLDHKLENEFQVRMTNDAPYLLSENFADKLSSESSADSDIEMGNDFNETPADVKLFSDEPIAGFLVPAGTQDSEKRPQSTTNTSDLKSVHFQVKEILNDIEWHSTTSHRTNWNKKIYEKETGNDSDYHSADNTTVFSSCHDFTIGWIWKSSKIDWEDGKLNDQTIIDRFTTGTWNKTENAKTLLSQDSKVRKQIHLNEERKHQIASGTRVQYKTNSNVSKNVAQSDEDMRDDDDDDDLAENDDDEGIFDDSDSENESVNFNPESKSEVEVDPYADYDKNLLRPTKRQKLLEKRKRHKALFDQLYDDTRGGAESEAFYDKMVNDNEAQQSLNREILKSLPEESASKLDGFPPGSYVRVELKDVPHQFIKRFDPCQPLVVGGLSSTEESFGYLKIRFRSHRWSKQILRSNDPLTISVGWRRYQTVCVYSKEEHNLRNRFLKYSLEHEHCLATVYGPIVPIKSGVIAFINSTWKASDSGESHLPKFRVAGTGVVLDTNKSYQIVKKLKLIGEPFKIFTKTAFIRGMFNSELEVSKMIGSRIQTVSKIRGLIKAALTNPSTSKPGDFRATFEAQIKMADLVFLRSFVSVPLPKYYNPVLNRLFSIDGQKCELADTADQDGPKLRLLRTLGELRWEKGIKPPNDTDSHYKPINRPVHIPTPLRVPASLLAAVPFAHKPKPTRNQALHKLGGDAIKKALKYDIPAPVKSAESETETRQELLTRLRHLHSEYLQRQHKKMVDRVTKHKQTKDKVEKIKATHLKKKRKAYFSKKGKNEDKSMN